MSRGALFLLLVLLCGTPRVVAAAAISDRISVLTGFLDVPPKAGDTFVVRVFTGWNRGVAEVLAERRLERGPFRVPFPVPDAPYYAVVTSAEHQPVLRSFRARQMQPRFKKPVRPVPWETAPVTVADPVGLREADVRVRSDFRPFTLAWFQWLPWFSRETRTDANGVALVPWARLGHLRVSTAGAWERSHAIRDALTAMRIVRRLPPRALYLRVHLRPGAQSPATVPLRVECRIDGAWTPAPPPEAPERGFPVLPGWTALRIAIPDYRPFVLIRGDRPNVTHVTCQLVGKAYSRRSGSILHVVPDGLAPVERPAPVCGTSSRGWNLAPYRMELHDASGRRCDHEIMDLPMCPPGRGLLPGTYTLTVRGRLGRPVVRRIEIPGGTDVRIPVDVTGGSGIRLVVRGHGGRAPKTVGFRVLDAAGEPVEVEYTDATLHGVPFLAVEGASFKEVPNAGLVRLDPGEWTVELLGGEEPETFPVRCWPNTVTRLDTRVRRLERPRRPPPKVRLR